METMLSSSRPRRVARILPREGPGGLGPNNRPRSGRRSTVGAKRRRSSWGWFGRGSPSTPSRKGGSGVLPQENFEILYSNCTFWCICSGFEQLLDMLSRVRQKSQRWQSRAAFCDDRLFHDALQARACSNRSVVFALFLTKIFLVMFWSETAFYSRRTSTVVACAFAAACLANHKGWHNICRFNDCVGNRCDH